MPLNSSQKTKIENLLSEKIEAKINNYNRETKSMPFLARIIQDNEKIAAYSFMHSMATTLGMSVYENISAIIGADNSEECFRHYGVGGVLSSAQKSCIATIIRQIRNGERKANIGREIEEVLCISSKNGEFQKSGNIADFFMIRNGVEHYFEIKTAKPNIDVFEKTKTKLLEWVARRRKPVKVYLALPYNPYHPKPYNHFSGSGLMEIQKDLLIGAEFWNFLGGKNTFTDLLILFDEIGKKYKKKLKQMFAQVAKEKMDSY